VYRLLGERKPYNLLAVATEPHTHKPSARDLFRHAHSIPDDLPAALSNESKRVHLNPMRSWCGFLPILRKPYTKESRQSY
jgi:hypothetical protein